jgi:hypothetical protein
MLRDGGVPVLAGTDSSSNVPTGALLHSELQLMVRAGLTPLETLRDATSVPARIFSLSNRGTIAPGKRAALLLVHGDPATDIEATRDIAAIWKQGVKFDRDAYRSRMAQRNEAWRFGSGWWPWADARYGGPSSVNVKVVDGGPGHLRTTMFLGGEVRSRASLPFAGVMYFPARWGFSPSDFSCIKDLAFWSRGDGRQYWVSVFTQTRGVNEPAPISFIADTGWQEHSIRLSMFGTDGHDVTGVFIGSAQPGKFELELSGFRIGTGAWPGVELVPHGEGPAGPESKSTTDVMIGTVIAGSPANRAEIKIQRHCHQMRRHAGVQPASDEQSHCANADWNGHADRDRTRWQTD